MKTPSTPPPMKHKINPQVDCVFKAILGSDENKLALLDFLNSILQPEQAIERVTIVNPFNERTSIEDKLTIVDVKVVDSLKRQYQIEIQMANHPYLPQRMIYTWSDIYSSQLKRGDEFQALTPVISIWLLNKNLFKHSKAYHHRFQLYDQQQQYLLSKDCAIHVLELDKWQKPHSLSPAEHWLYFFKEAYNWTRLPVELNTPAMRQAMDTLREISEQEREYHRYLSRKIFLIEQASQKRMVREAKEELERGEKELAKGRREVFESKKEIAEGKKELFENQKVIAEGKKEISQSKKVIAEGKKEISESKKVIAEDKKELFENQKVIAENKKVIERLHALLKDAGINPA